MLAIFSDARPLRHIWNNLVFPTTAWSSKPDACWHKRIAAVSDGCASSVRLSIRCISGLRFSVACIFQRYKSKKTTGVVWCRRFEQKFFDASPQPKKEGVHKHVRISSFTVDCHQLTLQKEPVMNENAITHLLLDAISTIFQTHPEPEQLRAAWTEKIEWYEQTFQASGKNPNSQVAKTMQLAKALLGEIPDHHA